ncbi:hypothetical protein P3X46_004378 [Hevea brasiliensis]|uniref:WRC domain-containing protein n=1 Tax=Hevea brasiliensis TaxID=3981 RepID=A0ABQ9N1E8_HEVBR|nr:uncharacterized protein LOC110633996 [Hevea brasiliensis]KAJ9184674.1 hypothetical protein P3X46_004378 [Hevea brasiliensis]
MRIRKRKVPFPLSSLSPVPLSDPHLSRSPSDQLQLLQSSPHQNFSPQDAKASFFVSQSSDQPNYPIGAHDCSDGSWKEEEKKVLMQEGEEKGGEGEKSNDTRGGVFLGAKTPTMAFQRSTSFHQDGRWCEGEKAFPFKKRRGSFERRSKEETLVEKDKKMKTKMNKKCMQRNGNEDGEEVGDKETKEGVHVDHRRSSSTKKRVRGGALMEGSRCSRVNGRGWRCCQQTLVGYSLCEHHLGKGRLRSMTSVRSRSMAKTATSKESSQPLSSPSLSLAVEETKGIPISFGDKVIGAVHGDEELIKKPLMMAKKKQKLGMVKARSISSLLGQANNAIELSENDE